MKRNGRLGSACHRVLGDLRHGLVALRGRPGFSLPAVATLALGIGTCATVFSVVEAVLIRRPAFVDPERLVMVWSHHREDRAEASPLSGADFADLRHRTTALAGVAGLGEVTVAPLVGTDRPEFARQVPTSANIFDVLGVEAYLGRTFVPADQTPIDPSIVPRPPTPVVISHAFWQRAFGGDRDVVGRSIRTFVSRNVVVGVLPPDFELVLPESRAGGGGPGRGHRRVEHLPDGLLAVEP